jgi:hypothetical protein
MAHAFEDQAAVSFLSGVAEARAGARLNLLLLQGGATAGWRCEGLRRSKSDIMSEYLDTHLKDMSDHTQLHAFYPFGFGKANRPETSVFPTGSVL